MAELGEPDQHGGEAQPVVVLPPELPPVPRGVTPHVSGVAWREPRVRFWVLLAGLIAAVMLYVLFTQLWAWSRESNLVHHGVATDATIVVADVDGTNGGQTNLPGGRRPWASRLQLKYLVNGQPVEVEGNLTHSVHGELIAVGDAVPIRYSAADPTIWTDRSEAPSFLRSITGLLVLGPIVALVSLAGVWKRGRILRTWREGELIPAAVLSSTATAVAPGYLHITALPTHAGAASVSAYVPKSRARPARGDVIWLLAGRGQVAVAAQAFL